MLQHGLPLNKQQQRDVLAPRTALLQQLSQAQDARQQAYNTNALSACYGMPLVYTACSAASLVRHWSGRQSQSGKPAPAHCSLQEHGRHCDCKHPALSSLPMSLTACPAKWHASMMHSISLGQRSRLVVDGQQDKAGEQQLEAALQMNAQPATASYMWVWTCWSRCKKRGWMPAHRRVLGRLISMP